MITSIASLLLLVLCIYAIIQILGSGASTAIKLLWILLVIVLPFLGVILWFFIGPKSSR